MKKLESDTIRLFFYCSKLVSMEKNTPIYILFYVLELVCKETAVGKGYAGTLQYSMNGHQCKPWIQVPVHIRASVWTSQDPDIIEQILPSLVNYCR